MYARRSFTVAMVVLAVLAAGIYYGARQMGSVDQATAFKQKMNAAQAMQAAERAIADARGDHAEENSTLADDRVIAAMLGSPNSPITTDSGTLAAKATSTNPNFAALMVDWLYEAGVRPNDVVAVAYTGSFPALDVGAIAAVEAIGADPIIVSSVGSSTWGANDPDFTILDIETLLMNAGLIHNRSTAASVGGDFHAHRISEEGRELAARAIERNGTAFLDTESLAGSIQQRLDIYDEQASGRPIRAFVNVGGGLASTGGGDQPEVAPGLTMGSGSADGEGQAQDDAGLLHQMKDRGIPVINLTSTEELAENHGFTVSPRTLPSIGEGSPWKNWARLRVQAGLAAAVIILIALGLRVFVIAPSGEMEFDSYLGFVPARMRRALSRIGGGLTAPWAVPRPQGEAESWPPLQAEPSAGAAPARQVAADRTGWRSGQDTARPRQRTPILTAPWAGQGREGDRESWPPLRGEPNAWAASAHQVAADPNDDWFAGHDTPTRPVPRTEMWPGGDAIRDWGEYAPDRARSNGGYNPDADAHGGVDDWQWGADGRRFPIGLGSLFGGVGAAAVVAALIWLPWFTAAGRDVTLADIRTEYAVPETDPADVVPDAGQTGSTLPEDGVPTPDEVAGAAEQQARDTAGTVAAGAINGGKRWYLELYAKTLWLGVAGVAVAAAVLGTLLAPRSRALSLLVGVRRFAGLALVGAGLAHGAAVWIVFFSGDGAPTPAYAVWLGVGGLAAVLLGCIIGPRRTGA